MNHLTRYVGMYLDNVELSEVEFVYVRAVSMYPLSWARFQQLQPAVSIILSYIIVHAHIIKFVCPCYNIGPNFITTLSEI